MDKKPRSLGRKDKRRPISQSKEASFISETPFWSFRLLDNSYHKWQIKEASELLNELKAFEGLTWNEIMNASGGRKVGSNSHYVPINNLIKEAKDRIRFLNLDSEDMIFSLRLSGKRRVYGLLRSRALEIIWYDVKHEIYPTEK